MPTLSAPSWGQGPSLAHERLRARGRSLAHLPSAIPREGKGQLRILAFPVLPKGLTDDLGHRHPTPERKLPQPFVELVREGDRYPGPAVAIDLPHAVMISEHRVDAVISKGGLGRELTFVLCPMAAILGAPPHAEADWSTTNLG